MGCNILARITNVPGLIGCRSTCTGNRREGFCNGSHCCQTLVPLNLQVFNATFESVNPNNDSRGCTSAFLVDEVWFFSLRDPYRVQNMEYVPAILDWQLLMMGWAFDLEDSFYHVPGANSTCIGVEQIQDIKCICKPGYEGNPYLENGCQDVDECTIQGICGGMKCVNTPGSFICKGYGLNTSIIIGIFAAIGAMLVFLIIICSWKISKKRQDVKRKKKFFRRNGGLLLEQQLHSSDGNFENTTKMFKLEELDKATDHFNENRILGRGGQGTVYKGMLPDGKIIAVKKSKIMEDIEVNHFINEVAILSQVNHRNVVKLLGCCLETEVPLLVYEFIPNGTLHQYIHDPNEEIFLSWEMRVRIASEVAEALAYLHSSASMPIYHRDIKSTNILLDEKYRAKVADFGTSRSISIDQTHLTTQIKGTFGYLDPEYFQSSQFTEKSDVYSFGVVLVELITGQKAVSLLRSEEGIGLASYFLQAMEKNHLVQIVSAQVMKEDHMDEIMAVANLAKRCLSLSGKMRPTMKEVALELEGVRGMQRASHEKQDHENVEHVGTEIMGEHWYEENSDSLLLPRD